MRMNRHSKTCRHFVKAEYLRTGCLKTLKKQHVELFVRKSQYELMMKMDKHAGERWFNVILSLSKADRLRNKVGYEEELVCSLALTM
jgi:uncharacterized protein YjbK